MGRVEEDRRRPGQPWYRIPPKYQTQHRPDAWMGPGQPRSTYLTTYELAEELGKWASKFSPATKRAPYDRSVYRWCVRDWFGKLPPERTGRGQGYRIPPNYLYVARLWHVTEDPMVRKVGLPLLAEDPRPWLVVVADVGSLHYTSAETAQRISRVLDFAQDVRMPLHSVYLGPIKGPESE